MKRTICNILGALSCLSAGTVCQATTAPLNVVEWGEASITQGRQSSAPIGVSVPLIITSSEQLAAAVIPLSFGQAGNAATLRDVEFEERFSEGDITIASVDNETKTALVTIISMASDLSQSNLRAGSSTVATLHFEIDGYSESSLSFTIEPNAMGHQLAFVDNGPQCGDIAVRQMRPETRTLSVDVQAANSSPLPKRFSLEQNYPNPFNAGTVISFDLVDAADWSLTIHNVLGQTIRSFNGDNSTGRVSVTWDGRTESGDVASSGVYLYRVSANGFTATKKMSLLK